LETKCIECASDDAIKQERENMPIRRAAQKKQKPLFELKTPLRARVYRAKFRPFESTKYLNAKALKSAKKATIECGTVEINGTSVTLSAEIRRGKIVSVKPHACESCSPKTGKKIFSRSSAKELLRTVARELENRGIPHPKMALAITGGLGFGIPIGPIVIIIGTDPDEGVDWFDFCIVIYSGAGSCIYCLLAPNACIGL
jgi:hypothetical protein